MKRMVAAILAAFLMVVLAQGAAAQEAPRRPHDRFDREGRGDGSREGMHGRPPGREAVWQGAPHQGQDNHASHGRMSPEERQQLRRDINSHGRDIYRDRGRR